MKKFDDRCEDPKLLHLTQEQTEQILKVHNDYRCQTARGKLDGYAPAKQMAALVTFCMIFSKER